MYVCMYLIVPQFRAFSPSLPLLCISDKQALFLFIPKATCGRTDRQTDRQTICIEQDVSTTSKLHISSYRAFRCFVPSTCYYCSFSSSSGSVGGEVILPCWRGFLSLVGDFEMWCVCKRYIYSHNESQSNYVEVSLFIWCVCGMGRARALSLSLCVCV